MAAAPQALRLIFFLFLSQAMSQAIDDYYLDDYAYYSEDYSDYNNQQAGKLKQ